MYKTTVCCLLALSTLCTGFKSSAQTSEGKGVIVGTVADASATPVEFATISLHLQKDSSLVTGAITDQTGAFMVEKVPAGSYYLKAGFIGFEPTYIPNISVTAAQPFVKLDPIALAASATSLGEVEIAAERNFVENKIDKKVYNVDKDASAKGGTGLDALRNIPSIEIDADDNIKLRGDQNVNVLIDGRPTSLPASQLLKQIPSSSIEKVEVVTNPSAKYDPEGMSGIINIKLKKSKNAGFNGSANLSYARGKFNRYNGSLGLNYRKGKVSANVTYNHYNGDHWYGGDNARYYVLGDSTFSQLTKDNGNYLSKSHYIKGGIDFFANDNNTLYIAASTTTNDGGGTRTLNYENFNNTGALGNFSERVALFDNPRSNYDLNGGWQKKFKNPDHTLDLDVNYMRSESEGIDDITQSFYDSDQLETNDPAMQITTTNEENKVLYSRLDYVLPITDSMKLEAGFHYTGRDIENGFYSESFNHAIGVYQPDTFLNNDFVYQQNVYAVYTTFGQQFKKLGYQVGLRVEDTQVDAELLTTNETFENNYISLFPSGHFSYQLNMAQEIRLSYSRRINRPELEELNPFATYSDAYTIQRGNPFLRPEYIDVYELGYMQYWKKFNVNATLYYRQINDVKRRYLSLSNTGMSVVSYENFDTGSLSGLELVLGVNPAKWMRNNITFNVFNTVVGEEGFSEDLNFNTTGWSVQLNSTSTLKKGFTFQVFGSYNGKMKVLQGVISPMYGMGFAVRKQVLQKRGSIGLTYTDIFKTRNFEFTSQNLTDYSFRTNRLWDAHVVRVSFNYFFGKRQQGKQKRRVKDHNSGDDFSTPDLQ